MPERFTNVFVPETAAAEDDPPSRSSPAAKRASALVVVARADGPIQRAVTVRVPA